MRELVLTPKFSRSYRKFARRNKLLQRRIDETLGQLRMMFLRLTWVHTN
jgi:hypothetical protein